MSASNARPIDVAIAAVTLINSAPAQGTFGSFAPFTAVRDYVPVADLKDHKAGLQVWVIPSELEETAFSRQIIQGIVTIDVGIEKYADTLASRDALMLLVEQIKTVLEKGLTLPEADVDCGWLGTENLPIFDQAYLQEKNVFRSAPRFRYLTRRAR